MRIVQTNAPKGLQDTLTVVLNRILMLEDLIIFISAVRVGTLSRSVFNDFTFKCCRFLYASL